MLEDQNDHQNEQGQQQIFHGAEVFCAVAAAKGIDTHRDQRKTDGKHNRTGDDRREELAQGLEEEAQHAFKNAADDGCTHNGTIGQHTAAHTADNTVEHANKAGTGTHDDGHATAHGADGEQLHQRDHTGHEHGTLQQRDLQICELTTRNAAGTGDDQQRGQVAHKHGADMLQTQRDRLFQGHFCVELIRRLFELDFLQMFHSPQILTKIILFDCFTKKADLL